MKLHIRKSDFLKDWQTAERSTSSKSTISSLTGILLKAEGKDKGILLEATDLKTSIKCVSNSVTIEEEGEAVLPVRVVGDLFKKAPTDDFTVQIADGKGTITAGRNRYRFTTYPAKEFPKLPVSESAPLFCAIGAADLLRTTLEGTVASTTGDEFPKYLGTAFFQLRDKELRVISTDGRRLSLSKCYPSQIGPDGDFLLPIAGVRELQRLLSALDRDAPIRIVADDSLVFFQMGSMEFSVRKVETAFPNYEKILNPQSTTTLTTGRDALVAALERVDIVVRDFTRMVLFHLSPEGDLTLTGKAPETGSVREILDGTIEGEPLTVAFNVGYFLDGLKALYGEKASMSFNGSEGQMTMLRPGETNFLYMVMPIKLTESDLSRGDDDENGEAGGEAG